MTDAQEATAGQELDVTDDANLRPLDAANEAEKNAVLGHTHARIRPTDPAEAEAAAGGGEKERRRKHRATELLKRGTTRDGHLRPLLRPKLPVILLLAAVIACVTSTVFYAMGAPAWLCAGMGAVVLAASILGYAFTELMIRYPCIINALLIGTGICEDAHRTPTADQVEEMLVPVDQEDAAAAAAAAAGPSFWNCCCEFFLSRDTSAYLAWDRPRYSSSSSRRSGGAGADVPHHSTPPPTVGEQAKTAAQNYVNSVVRDLEVAQEATDLHFQEQD